MNSRGYAEFTASAYLAGTAIRRALDMVYASWIGRLLVYVCSSIGGAVLFLYRVILVYTYLAT